MILLEEGIKIVMKGWGGGGVKGERNETIKRDETIKKKKKRGGVARLETKLKKLSSPLTLAKKEGNVRKWVVASVGALG